MGSKNVKIIRVEGTPEWMISFGDLMSCLLVFFILLLTFSSKAPGKLMDMMGDYSEGSESSQVANDEGDASGNAGEKVKIAVKHDEEAPTHLANLVIANKFADFELYVQSLGFKHSVTATMADEGVMVQISAELLFDRNNRLQENDETLLVFQSLMNIFQSLKKEMRIISDPGTASAGQDMRVSMDRTKQIKKFFAGKYELNENLLTSGIEFGREKSSRIDFIFVTRPRPESTAKGGS